MISDLYRCVFVHIPRVGGTSMELALTGLDWWNVVHIPAVLQAGVDSGEMPGIVLNEHDGYIKMLAEIQPKHLSAEETYQSLGSGICNGYFTFSFVRNPWDRLVSLYESTKDLEAMCKARRFPWQVLVYSCLEERGYLDENGEFTDFTGFARSYKPLPWETRHHTQAGFLRECEGFKGFDFIGRFENLEEDFAHISRLINFPAARLPAVNSSDRGPYRDYYDSETRDFVATEYAADVAMFHYSF